jgi:microcystin-dependent protein
MTISKQQVVVVHYYSGNTPEFTVPFPFYSGGLTVSIRPPTLLDDDPDIVLVEGADYTILQAQQVAGIYVNGSTIKVTSPLLVTDTRVAVQRTTPITQTLDLVPKEVFPAVNFERALDKIEMIAVELDYQFQRALSLDPVDEQTATTIQALLDQLTQDITDAYLDAQAAQAQADQAVLNAQQAAQDAANFAAQAGQDYSLLTTKGDLLTFDTEPIRKGVGSDTQTIVADSTEAAGWKWGVEPGPLTNVPVGDMRFYAGSTEPAREKFTNGQAISRTTYSALFAVIGTTFGGGDGSTTFNLPDERGRFQLGKDNMGGASAGRVTSASTGGANSTVLGGTGGTETTTLAMNNLPAALSGSVGKFTGTGTPGGPVPFLASVNLNGIVNNTGGGNAHNIMNPWIACNKIIHTGV